MLARSAQGLYWMGRYLERADHLCRLLRLQTDALVDRPVAEIYAGWNRIYASLNRQPPGTGPELLPPGADSNAGTLQVMGVPGTAAWQQNGGDDYTLADSFTLADDLTFERSNPGSVWNCFAQGRENARQMRHCISPEMWTSLNLAYLRIQQVGITDIWNASPESFYATVSTDVDTFMGVAAATMYRDEGWRFMRLGRFMERAQLAAALFLAQLELFPADADPSRQDGSESDWVALLRLYHAMAAYNHTYSVAVAPNQVLDLLVTDPLLPDSLCSSLNAVAAQLAAIAPGPDRESDQAARSLARRLSSLVHYDWPGADDRAALLLSVNDYSRQLHNLLTATYFDYQIAAARLDYQTPDALTR